MNVSIVWARSICIDFNSIVEVNDRGRERINREIEGFMKEFKSIEVRFNEPRNIFWGDNPGAFGKIELNNRREMPRAKHDRTVCAYVRPHGS